MESFGGPWGSLGVVWGGWPRKVNSKSPFRGIEGNWGYWMMFCDFWTLPYPSLTFLP